MKYGKLVCDGLTVDMIEEFEAEREQLDRCLESGLYIDSNEPVRYFRTLIALGLHHVQPKEFLMAVAYVAALLETVEGRWNTDNVRLTVRRIVARILPRLETDKDGVVFVELLSTVRKIKPS